MFKSGGEAHGLGRAPRDGAGRGEEAQGESEARRGSQVSRGHEGETKLDRCLAGEGDGNVAQELGIGRADANARPCSVRLYHMTVKVDELSHHSALVSHALFSRPPLRACCCDNACRLSLCIVCLVGNSFGAGRSRRPRRRLFARGTPIESGAAGGLGLVPDHQDHEGRGEHETLQSLETAAGGGDGLPRTTYVCTSPCARRQQGDAPHPLHSRSLQQVCTVAVARLMCDAHVDPFGEIVRLLALQARQPTPDRRAPGQGADGAIVHGLLDGVRVSSAQACHAPTEDAHCGEGAVRVRAGDLLVLATQESCSLLEFQRLGLVSHQLRESVTKKIGVIETTLFQLFTRSKRYF
eukprot:4026244-Pleurochrysis_carterae.AAC.5